MRSTFLRLIAGVVVAGALVVGCGNGDDGQMLDTAAITFERFDGTEGSLADYAGTPLVVNFWSTTCAPCVREMPALEAVHQDLGDEVAFLGLDVQDSLEAGKEFAARTGVTWDLGRDPSGSIIRELGGIGLPTTVLIDEDGRIVERHTGELTEREAADLIERALLS